MKPTSILSVVAIAMIAVDQTRDAAAATTASAEEAANMLVSLVILTPSS